MRACITFCRRILKCRMILQGEEYKLFWPDKSEFVRMAARFGAKIVPFGVVGEDDFAEVIKAKHENLILFTFIYFNIF